MTAGADPTARLGALRIAAVCAALLLGRCGTNVSGSTGGGAASLPQTDVSGVATPASGAGGSGDKIAATIAATPAPAVDRAEIERRLALPRFTYVGETDSRGAKGSSGALAFIDSETDTLAFRPHIGSDLGRVAMAPDGRLIYVVDLDEPVVWVVDAETREKVGSIRLPGVTPSKRRTMTVTAKYP